MEGVPTHNANAWLRYAAPGKSLRGLGAGLGCGYQRERWASATRTPEGKEATLPDYLDCDAALYYSFGNLDVNLNVYNPGRRSHGRFRRHRQARAPAGNLERRRAGSGLSNRRGKLRPPHSAPSPPPRDRKPGSYFPMDR